MPSSYKVRQDKAAASIAVRNIGIISGRCLYYHKFLPPNVRDGYDVEDFISDVVCHVVKQQRKFDPGKAKESTWIWHVADRSCRSKLSYYNSQRLKAEVVEIEEVALPPAPGFERRKIAFNAVERVIEAGSDGVLWLVDAILSGEAVGEARARRGRVGTWLHLRGEGVLIGIDGKVLAGSPEAVGLVEELRESFKRHGASLEDLRLVLNYA